MADIGELVDTGRTWGVKIIPEVDSPGHAYSWICGYPGIMTCAGPGSQSQAVCPEPPCGFLNLADPSVYTQVQDVVQGVLEEVLTAFRVGEAGISPYIHIGFDEVGCPVRTPAGSCTAPSCVAAYGPQSVRYGNDLLDWLYAKPDVQVIMWVDQVLTSNFVPAPPQVRLTTCRGGRRCAGIVADPSRPLNRKATVTYQCGRRTVTRAVKAKCPDPRAAPATGDIYVPNLKVDKDKVVLQFWNLDNVTPGRLRALADLGFRLINSQANVYYLDAGGEGNAVFWGGAMVSAVPPPVPPSPAPTTSCALAAMAYQKYWMAAYPGVGSGLLTNGWPTSWEDIHQNNPLWLPTTVAADFGAGGVFAPGNFVYVPQVSAGGTPGPGGILGVCACMWGEQTDATNLEQKVWPKAAALAEAAWRFNENRAPDVVANARLRIVFAREDLVAMQNVAAAPVMSADTFRLTPWGPLGSPTTSLMYDINQPTPQIPDGYAFNFKRYWGAAGTCGAGIPYNPFCGGVASHTVRCDDPTQTAPALPQQGCPYPLPS